MANARAGRDCEERHPASDNEGDPGETAAGAELGAAVSHPKKRPRYVDSGPPGQAEEGRVIDPQAQITVYGLKDPRDGRFRYVGQSSNPIGRFAVHLKPSSRIDGSPRSLWLAELAAAGLRPIMIELAVVAWTEAHAAERDWVAILHGQGHPLLNVNLLACQTMLPRPVWPPVLSDLMTVKQAAEEKQVSTTAVYNAIGSEGPLHGWRIGAIAFVLRAEVANWTPRRRGPNRLSRRKKVE